MRKIIGAATLLLVFATILAPSATARERFDTEIEVLDGEPVGEDFLLYGLLESAKNKCLRNRDLLMWVTIEFQSARFAVDAATSSRHGAWALINPEDDIIGMEVEVFRKKLRNGDVCKGSTVGVDFR